jgi:hypothetical protein
MVVFPLRIIFIVLTLIITPLYQLSTVRLKIAGAQPKILQVRTTDTVTHIKYLVEH